MSETTTFDASQPSPRNQSVHGGKTGGGANPTDPPDASNGGNGLVRVTVNLLPVAAQALDHLCEVTGYSKTDVINRALQVYEVWEQVAAPNGGTVVVKHHTGETERIRLL